MSGWFARETESHLYEKAFRKIVLNFAPEFLEKNDGRKKHMKQITNIIYPTFAVFALACFALSPEAQAVVLASDGGYAGGNTAEGENALLSLTTGTYDTALGLYSLLSDSTGNFNAGVGAGTLLVDTAALLSDTSGEFNTAGTSNTANGTVQSNAIALPLSKYTHRNYFHIQIGDLL